MQDPHVKKARSREPGPYMGLGIGCLPLLICLLLQLLFFFLVHIRQFSPAKVVLQVVPIISITARIAVLIYTIITSIRQKQWVFGIPALIILAITLLISPGLLLTWVMSSDALPGW